MSSKVHAAILLKLQSALDKDTDMERAMALAELVETNPELIHQAFLATIEHERAKAKLLVAQEMIGRFSAMAHNAEAKL